MKTKILTTVFTIAFLSIFSLSAQEHDHSKMKKDTTKMEIDASKKAHELTHVVQQRYVCPMHADVKSDKPGDCPKCGMELKEKKMDMKMDSTKMEIKHGSMKMDHSKMDKKTESTKIGDVTYACPMQCEGEKTYNKPGSCPKCNMDLKKQQ